MSEADVAAAMAAMDDDGSGEVDKAEFKKWFRELAAPTVDGGPSPLDQMRARAVMADASVAGLARRLPEPSAAICGPTALPTLLEQCGGRVRPAGERVPAAAGGAGGSGSMFTVKAHCSTGGASSVDGVSLRLPQQVVTAGAASAEDAARVFAMYDSDGSGSIDAAELATVTEALGRRLGPAELAAAMADMDSDGSGEVDVDEFAVWWERSLAAGPGKSRGGGNGVSAKAMARQLRVKTAAGTLRARSHCRFVSPLIHFIPDPLTYLVPLTLGMLADAVGGCLALNYGFAPVPGSGSARRGGHRVRQTPRWPRSWANPSLF
jgi:hypothetical protein